MDLEDLEEASKRWTCSNCTYFLEYEHNNEMVYNCEEGFGPYESTEDFSDEFCSKFKSKD